MDDSLEVGGIHAPARDRGSGEKRFARLVSPLLHAVGDGPRAHRAVGASGDREIVADGDRRQHAARHFLAPFDLAVLEIHREHLALRVFDQLFVKADAAATDEHRVARHGRAGPRIVRERRFP